MALDNVLAREYDLTINTGTVGSPTWTPIAGITGINPAQSAQRTDDSDYDTDGWEKHTVAMRGRSLSVTMNYLEDPDDSSTDPGQDAVIAAGDAMGTSGKKQFKYVSPEGIGHIFTATVDVAWPGGDKVANAAFTAELTMTGAPTAVTALAAPTITGISPATGDTAGGDPVLITGTNFVAGSTTVTFGGTAATSVAVVSSTQMYVTTPAHAAGAVNVVVTNAAGAVTETSGYTYA